MLRDQELAGLAMTLGKDAKITVTVGGDTSYCKPDGSHINIARLPSTPLGRMLMTGLVFHETGHKNFTRGGRPQGLLGDMMNVIEDIRVDLETIKARPGTCFNLEAVTAHYVAKGSLVPTSLPQALIGKVMAYGFGRVLKHAAILPVEKVCDEMMDDAFGQEFIDEVELIIKDIPTLRSTKEAAAMAQRLIDLIVQQQAPPPQTQQQARKQLTGGTGAAGSGHDHKQQGGSGRSGSSQQNRNRDVPKQDDPQQTAKIRKSGFGGNGAGKGGGKRPTPEEITEMLKRNTGYGDLSQLIQSELNTIAQNTPSSIKAGIPQLPVIGKLQHNHGKLHEVKAIAASSRMRARLMGLLQSIKRQPVSFGLTGRRLASERLVKLAAGDPRIFRKKVETGAVNTAVVVLLDLSGSMCSKYTVANAAAFALHTTLYGLRGVAVCSLEFSGKDKKPDVSMLTGFGNKPLSENFNHHPFDGTPTETAIWAGRALLLQRPEPRKIMLILTDGGPDRGSETIAATQRTMKDGIEIAAIGIMDSSVRNYWNNHRVISTIEELPAAMFGVMQGLLTKRNTNKQVAAATGA